MRKRGDVRMSYLIGGIIAAFILVLMFIGIFAYGGNFSRFFSWLPDFVKNDTITGVSVIRYDIVSYGVSYFVGDGWESFKRGMIKNGEWVYKGEEVARDFLNFTARLEFKMSEEDKRRFKGFVVLKMESEIFEWQRVFFKTEFEGHASDYFYFRAYDGKLLYRGVVEELGRDRNIYVAPVGEEDEYFVEVGKIRIDDKKEYFEIDKEILERSKDEGFYNVGKVYLPEDVIEVLKSLDGVLCADRTRYQNLGSTCLRELNERSKNTLRGPKINFDLGNGYELRLVWESPVTPFSLEAPGVEYSYYLRVYFKGHPLDVWVGGGVNPLAISAFNFRNLLFYSEPPKHILEDANYKRELDSFVERLNALRFEMPVKIRSFRGVEDSVGRESYYCVKVYDNRYLVVDLDKSVKADTKCVDWKGN